MPAAPPNTEESMYFKNLHIYRLSPEWPITLDARKPNPNQ